MKKLSPALQAHLDSGATTLAWCWRLVRRDGGVLGFTDHDLDLRFDGTTFEAAAGLTTSEIRDSVGLSVDNLTVESALTSTFLSDHDLAAGFYDDAAIEIWRVNWSDITQRVLMRSGSIGEVQRSGHAFSAEIRGLSHYLQQPQGRLYQYTCDATLGDSRCGVDVSKPAYRANVIVSAATSSRRFNVSGAAVYASDWFTRGLCRVVSGSNAGTAIEIKRHTVEGTIATIELWQPLADLPNVGDTMVLTAGCDKNFETCAARFNNAPNFRGFPHMPGNDYVTSVARPGDPANNGSALFQSIASAIANP
jgi:uncharacterized phage protein (TIGR02218 family)